jgi:two-component system sensor histidine kinase ChiS
MIPKILVVDDEKDLHALFQHKYRKQIKNRELEFYFANNGVEALESLTSNPDLNIILTDINMPVMDGLTFLSNLPKLDRLYKAIVISAYGDMANIRSAMNKGASDFVTKPIDFSDFEVTLKKMIDEYTRLHEALESKLRLESETQRQVQVFQRFVPRQLLETLHKESILDIKLGDHLEVEMCILFSDLRNFTAITERLGPEEVFDFLNTYIGCMEPAIHRNNGFIVSFLGDGLMNLFREPTDAVKAAIGIQQKVVEFNSLYKDERYYPLSSGIGLHRGNLMMGIVGVNERMQGTVISDAVNVSSRLEEVAARTGSLIIASEEFMKSINLSFRNTLELRSLGKIHIKGKQQPIALVEIICPEIDPLAKLKLQTRQLFSDGIELFFKKQYEEAIAKFQAVLQQNSRDMIANRYLETADMLYHEGESPSWIGEGVVL